MLKGIFLSSLILMITLTATSCDLIKPEPELPVDLHLSSDYLVQSGDTVHFGLYVSIMRKPQVRLHGRPAHDFVVTTDDGREVWRWSGGKTIDTNIQTQPIGDLFSLTLTGEWDQRDSEGRLVPPGTYWVRGVLNLDQQQLVTKRTRLIIQPGSPPSLQLEILAEVDPYWRDLYWRLGRTLPLKLTLKNRSDGPVSVTLRNRPAYDFVVTTADGIEVWRWSDSTIVEEALDHRTLKPGEELEFTAEWNQRDSQGNSIAPGPYGIQGFLYTDQAKPLEARGAVTIGAGLSLMLSLQAPTEVESGKAVLLQLKIKNMSDKALKLKTGAAPADFVVTAPSGREVWRWSYGKVFPLPLLPLTLRRGESKEYPIIWDQTDNEGYPVAPGTYWIKGTFRAAEIENLWEITQSELQKLVIKP